MEIETKVKRGCDNSQRNDMYTQGQVTSDILSDKKNGDRETIEGGRLPPRILFTEKTSLQTDM